MACCAIAAFIICSLAMFFRRVRHRLFGMTQPLPAENPAVAWKPGVNLDAKSCVPRRRASSWLVATAFGLAFAGTAMANRFIEPGAPRSALDSMEQLIERSYASICGQARSSPGSGGNRKEMRLER